MDNEHFVSQSADVGQWLSQMNLHYAVATAGNGVVILNEEGGGRVRLFGLRDFKTLMANARVSINDKRVPVADLWLQNEDRRQYSEIAFEPSGAPPGAFNLWNGFGGPEPVEGEWGAIRFHIKEVICSGNAEHYRYIVQWLAHLIQKPGQKPGVAIALRGKEGTGKGLFATDIVGGLVGESLFVKTDKAAHVVGHFNAHLWKKIVVFCDESFFAGDHSAIGALKSLITERHQLLEAKGKDPLMVHSYGRVIFASNEGHVFHATADDRRFFALDVSDEFKGDDVYFRDLKKFIPEQLAAFRYALAEIDLSDFDPFACPKTEAHRDQEAQSMDNFQQWAAIFEEERTMSVRRNDVTGASDEVIVDLDNTLKLSASREDVLLSYQQFAKNLGERHLLGPIPFGMRIKSRWGGQAGCKRSSAGSRRMQYDFSFLAEPGLF